MKAEKEEFIKEIENFGNEVKSFSNYLDVLKVHGCDLLNSDLIETAQRVQDIAIKNIAIRFGLTQESAEWFVYENDFGENKMECVNQDGEDYHICNASDFWEFEKGE